MTSDRDESAIDEPMVATKLAAIDERNETNDQREYRKVVEDELAGGGRDDVEDHLREYRKALVAEAELARTDLDEIEDHLRLLAADLQATGMDRAEAIIEACRRLGEPGAVAREHARVRAPFGAKLPRLRAWSAAALLTAAWIEFERVAMNGDGAPGLTSVFGINLVISTVALCGLIARASWARAILVGALSWFIIDTAIVWYGYGVPRDPYHVWRVASLAAAFVFVAPWRRVELAPAGYVIVLLAWAYHSACVMARYQLTSADQLPFVNPAGTVAFVATLLAGIGALVRARWAALAALVAAVALAIGYVDFSAMTFRFDDPLVVRFTVLGAIAAGVLASAVAAIIAWRSARSRLGTLRQILD